jgi:hypothetical protein
MGLAFAAALVALVVWRRSGPDYVSAAAHLGDASQVGLGLAAPPRDVVSMSAKDGSSAALTPVKTSNAQVAFYWVSSTEWDQP